MLFSGTVYTAGPANGAIKDSIERHFETILGQRAILTFYEDDSLIGGFRAVINGKMYDASLLAKTKNILAHLKSRK